MKTSAGICALFCTVLFLSSCSNLITPVDDEAISKVATAPSDAIPVPKKKLLVLRFINKSHTGGDALAYYATDKISSAFHDDDGLVLVPSKDVEGNETFLNEVGDYDLAQILSSARSHNISGILLGTIQNVAVRQAGEEAGLFRMREYTVDATVHVQLIDAATGREIFSKLGTAQVSEEHTEFLNDRSLSSFDSEHGQSAVSRAIDKVTPDLPLFAHKLSWSGRIAKVDLRRYYINAGEQTGLTRGQILKVFDDSQPVYDPDSHALLGLAPGRFKGLLKVVDYFGSDGAVAILYSGGGFKERDRVEYFSSTQDK